MICRILIILNRYKRSYTRRIFGLESMSYPQRLTICKLEPLELRRLKRDMIFVYKIKNGLVKLDFNNFFRFAPDVGTRGHRYKLYPINVSTQRSLSSFAHRVVNTWNKLPDVVVESTCLTSFKANLDLNVDKLIPLLRGQAFRSYS